MDPAVAGATVAALPIVATIAAVTGYLRHGKRKVVRAQMARVDQAGSQRDAALIVALGYDPTKHRILPSNGKVKGLRVVDDDMNVQAFFTKRQLGKPHVRKAWAQAMRETQVVVQR